MLELLILALKYRALRSQPKQGSVAVVISLIVL